MAGHGRRSPARHQHERWPLVAGLALLLPVGTALFWGLWGQDWYPPSDWAIETLRIREVGGSHTPLVGAPSRLGWDHPGPLLFWVLAPFERLLGEVGILVGAALLNCLALAGSIWVAARRGGASAAVLVGLAGAVLVRSLGVSHLMDPWNPWVAVLPFLFFVVLAWAVGSGDRMLLPWMVGVGTFVVQAHVGYIPLVAGISLATIGFRALTRWAPGRHGRGVNGSGWMTRWRWPLVGVLVGVALWLPPLIEELTGDPGNISDLVDYFTDSSEDEEKVGWTNAVGISGRQLEPIGPWVTGHENNALGLLAAGSAKPAVAVLLLVVALAGLAWWRGSRPAAGLTAVVLAGNAVGVLATAQVSGAPSGYLVRWWWPLAALTYASGAWSLASVLEPAVRPYRRPLAAAGVAGIVAISLWAAVQTFPPPVPEARFSDSIEGLAPETSRSLDEDQRYVVTSTADVLGYGGIGIGLLTELEAQGYQVFGMPTLRHALGRHRTLSPRAADGTIVVAAGTDRRSGWVPPPDALRIASFDPLSPAERLEATELEDRIRRVLDPTETEQQPIVPGTEFQQAVLVDAGASRADVERLADLQAQGDSYEVYLAPGT